MLWRFIFWLWHSVIHLSKKSWSSLPARIVGLEKKKKRTLIKRCFSFFVFLARLHFRIFLGAGRLIFSSRCNWIWATFQLSPIPLWRGCICMSVCLLVRWYFKKCYSTKSDCSQRFFIYILFFTFMTYPSLFYKIFMFWLGFIPLLMAVKVIILLACGKGLNAWTLGYYPEATY